MLSEPQGVHECVCPDSGRARRCEHPQGVDPQQTAQPPPAGKSCESVLRSMFECLQISFNTSRFAASLSAAVHDRRAR